MRNKLCSVDFITLWDDGIISVDDGVGYTGELCTMETMELYQALRKFFEVEKVSSHNSESVPCDHDMVAVSEYRCNKCGWVSSYG